jgi:osmoprotectant transport system substrate-binding protein
MHHQKRKGILFAALAAATVLAACAAPPAPPTAVPITIKVGSKLIAEDQMLAEMYALLLENAGLRVERRFRVGPTEVIHPALVAGDVDLYPEYTGTALLDVLKLPAQADPLAVFNTVANEYARRFNVTWLAPANINNTQAIAMTKARAAELRIVTMSDFARVAANLAPQGTPLVLAGPPEFETRNDGLVGFRAVYGETPLTFVPVASGERYEQLTAGQADAVVAFGTDGEVNGFDLATLIDDKQWLPPYQVAPVVRQQILDRAPAIRDALNPLATRLSDDVLRNLNFRMTVEGEPAADLAREFLVREGLIAGTIVRRPVNYTGAYRIVAATVPGRIDAQYQLALNPDGTAAITAQTATTETLHTDTSIGTWTHAANIVTAVFTQTNEQLLQTPMQIKLTFDDEFIVAIDASGMIDAPEQLQYLITSGDAAPAMRRLHERLAAVPWLGFTDPGPSGDTYTQETRAAVVAFQESQGLLPTGSVDAETWLALKAPQPPNQSTPEVEPTLAPDATPTPRGMNRTHGVKRMRMLQQVPTVPPPQPCTPSIGFEGGVNLRSAPSTSANVLAIVPAGTTLPATGVNAQGTWYQVDFYGTTGWVSRDVVTPVCVESLPVVDVPVPAAQDKVLYLSFDDGPNSTWTPQIMQVLQENNARAVFFQIGQQVPALGNIVKEELSAGMSIGNHTWSHPSLNGIAKNEFDAQITKTESAQREEGAYTQAGTHCLRPPYGATDDNTRAWAQEKGYRVMLWDIDPQDWALPGAQQIADTIIQHARPGAIVLSHDGGGNRSQTVDAYRIALPQLAAQGYRFEAPECP